MTPVAQRLGDFEGGWGDLAAFFVHKPQVFGHTHRHAASQDWLNMVSMTLL